MERNFKDEALKTVNGFKEVKSVICIVSDGENSSACIGSEEQANLQNMLISTMLRDNAILALFKEVVVATEVLKGEEK